MTDESAKTARVVEARMKLRARFEQAQAQSPSRSDRAPQGTGPKNRHGMPQIPTGQVKTEKWPVLDLGVRPKVTTTEQWRLVIDGAVKHPLVLDWPAMLALPQVDDVSDFH
ncbi:MAG TPA: sulfite oxidase-like oxidoreductase, partial [Myxococcota bacterium]